MGKGFDLNLSGVESLKGRLNKLTEEVRVGVIQEIQATGEDIDTEAKSRVPVDTGFLKGSINHRNLDNGTEINAGGESIAQKDYAAYVEFGTGSKVLIPEGLELYASEFKGAGIKEVNLPARPYMFPAYFAEKPKLIKRIEERINKA